MTNSPTTFQATTPLDLRSRIVDIGLELARQDGRKAAAMVAAAGVPFRVIVRVVSEPTLCRCGGHPSR